MTLRTGCDVVICPTFPDFMIQDSASAEEGHAPISTVEVIGGWKDAGRAAAIFLLAGLVYLLTGATLPIRDALPNMASAVSMVEEGNTSLTPEEVPTLFRWELKRGTETESVQVSTLDAKVGDLYRSGELSVSGTEVEITPMPSAGRYANVFGLGAGLTAVPLAAAVRLFSGPLIGQTDRLYTLCRYVAILCVAGSAAFVYLAARTYARSSSALVASLMYAFGTSVWTMSSQSLWQAPANELFLAIALWAFLRCEKSLSNCAISGFALGMATLCRPTSAVFVMLIAGYLLRRRISEFAVFMLAGAPLAGLLAAFNTQHYGSPFTFGQLTLQEVALDTTGSSDIWQTPILTGLASHLFGPSRGLFVFSPVLLVSVAGLAMAWWLPRYRLLRPWSLGVLAILIVESKHFDYWGGWCFGDRHVLDLAVVLAVAMTPVLGAVRLGGLRWGMLGLLGAWSVGVQVIGVTSYDLYGWNGRMAAEVRPINPSMGEPYTTFDVESLRPVLAEDVIIHYVEANIDDPKYRDRLWSWTDNQILFYATHWSESRRNRAAVERSALLNQEERLAETKRSLAEGYLRLHDFQSAKSLLDEVLVTWPRDERAEGARAIALAGLDQWESARKHLLNALNHRPDSVRLLMTLGFVDALRGKHAEAADAWTRALEQNPVFWSGLFRVELSQWMIALQETEVNFLRKIRSAKLPLDAHSRQLRQDWAEDRSRGLPFPSGYDLLQNN